MIQTRRISPAFITITAMTTLALTLLANTGTSTPAIAQDKTPTVTIKQDAGKIVYWVLPGPRRLSEKTFGTADHPKLTFKPKLQKARDLAKASKLPPTVPKLLEDMPILVAVPVKAREEGPDGGLWLKQPTPFSDKAEIVQGNFTSKLWDNVAKDPPGPPAKTPDKATMTANFTDPSGNKYQLDLKHAVKPPFPGYQTGGGVVVDTTLHGSTGTGTPLMPEEKTYAAWWGVGDLYVNGKLADKGRVMHLMTTEVVRDKNYHLALDEEMPLAPDQRIIKGQEHHTHLIVLPIKATKKGPIFQPVPTAFKLPNGNMQPFIHVMFEEDTVEH